MKKSEDHYGRETSLMKQVLMKQVSVKCTNVNTTEKKIRGTSADMICVNFQKKKTVSTCPTLSYQ